MADSKSSDAGDTSGTEQPSEIFRSIVSLVLIIHFFCVFVGMTCVAQPFSPFQARLRYVLWPYTQLFSFDLDGKPYYLTEYIDPGVAAEDFTDAQTDFRIEVLPAGKDPSDDSNWISLSDTGLKGGERRKRYQRLATRMVEVSENNTAVSLLAQGVGNEYHARLDELPQKIRVRTHLPQPRSWIESSNKERLDPDSPAYFRTLVSFNVTGLLSDGTVGLSEAISAAEAATTDAPQSASGETPNDDKKKEDKTSTDK